MRALVWWLAGLAVMTQGCVEEVPYTQVTVRLRALPIYAMGEHRLRVRVWSGRYDEIVRDCFTAIPETAGDQQAVIDVPVFPQDNDAPGEFTIQADVYPTATDASRPLAWQRAIVEFVPDEVQVIALDLTGNCIGCRDDQTCVDLACAGACFGPNAAGQLIRGDCEGPAGPFDACVGRAPAVIHGTVAGGEAYCDADDACYCREPEGCLPADGAAACCRVPPRCPPDAAACQWRRAEGTCDATMQRCPGEARCVTRGTVEACCAGGLGTCRGT